MDKRICVYEIGESDYASNGLGAISPTKCLVHWEENNEYSAEIEHPIDSLGKYERLNACGRTVVIPVPEAPSMRLNRTGSTTSVAVYTIATRKSRLRLRSGPGTNHKCLGYYAKGSKVTLINQTNASWYEVTAPDGKHGWMSADYLSFSHNQTVGSVKTEILRDLPMRPQPFDIYAIDPGLDAVSVKARHVFYRLAENLVCSLEIKNKTAQQALDAVFAAAEYQDHGFNWYCEDTQAMSLEDVIEGKNIVDIILGDGGICETYGLKLLVDWFDIFLVKEIGQDRGVQLRYAKNLQGLEGGIDASNVVTRVVPVGQTKDGKPLYLSGQKYVESSNASSYPRPIYGYLRVSDAKVDSEVNGQTVTTASARAMMQDAAQAELDAGCDLPDCSITATMTQLRYDPAYADYAELERICPGDTLGLFVPNFGLALSIRLSGYAFDALNQSYNEMTLGSPRTNMTNAGISSRQLGGMSVTASKIAPGAIGAPALADDVVSARHVQANSINTEALQAECVTALKIAAEAIQANHICAGAIQASHISAAAIDTILANIDTAIINNAQIDWAEIANLSVQIADIAKAQITQANIEDADIEWADIASLTAAVADIAEAKIAGASITSAQIDDLSTVVAQLLHAQVATGEFDFAEVENFLGSVFVLGQGVAGSVSIENLTVTQANMLGAVIGSLVLPGEDGKYYEVTVGTDGALSTAEVAVSSGEVAAGVTEGGKPIATTSINAESIHGSTVTAQQGILNTILTQALTAGQITAGQALIASATVPTLYATSIQAIGNSLTFTANERIQFIVSSVSQAQSAADDAASAAETAQGTADGAVSAASAAQSTADAAQQTANGAQSAASAAQSAADAAQSAATGAQSTADAAQQAASDAQGTANAAQTAANTAQSAASAAQSAADANAQAITGLTGRVTIAETAIEQTQQAISLRATKEEVEDSIEAVTGSVDAVSQTVEELGELVVSPEELVSRVTNSTPFQTLQSEVSQTASGLTFTQSAVSDIEGRVESLESGVHIGADGIDIYKSNSAYRMHIDNVGWAITGDGQETIAARESKMFAPRVQVNDALIMGRTAWKVGSDGFSRWLKY